MSEDPEYGQELVQQRSITTSSSPPQIETKNTSSSNKKKSVQESLLEFLESKKYGAIYLENEEGKSDHTSAELSFEPPPPFEIKDKERLSDPYALTAKFTNSSGLPQVVFDEVDYYVPNNNDDITISEMSSTIAGGGSKGSEDKMKKTFLKGSVASKGKDGASMASTAFKSKKSGKTSTGTGGTSAIADQMKLINSKASGLSGETKEAKEAKSFFNLGLLYSSPEERKYTKAEEYFCRALNARLKVYGKTSFDTAEAYEKLADVLVLMEDSNTARMYYSEALQSTSNRVDGDNSAIKEMELRIRKSLSSMPLSSSRDPKEHTTLWDSIVSS